MRNYRIVREHTGELWVEMENDGDWVPCGVFKPNQLDMAKKRCQWLREEDIRASKPPVIVFDLDRDTV